MARRSLGTLVSVVLLLVGVAPSSISSSPASYRNPVSKGFAETFADPAVIKAKDGYWYSYGTSDPLRAGDEYHLLPMARSDDLVNWTYVGDAFTESNSPDWMATPQMWAPDISYFDGRYYLYYVVTNTTVSESDFDPAIGVATAPTPAGPWTDSGGPIVGPREDPNAPGSYLWTFDPDQLTGRNGARYLCYGSYYGGVFVTRLSRDGLRAVGDPTQVAIDNRYEGTYVIRHGAYYYLFASAANCCAGPTTGYSVFVGRSRSPRGPFRDRAGDTLTESRVGGTNVIQPNGNIWVGTGHNSIATDLAGQDWFVYHAIDRRDPYLEEPFGINERPMLIDRLDWINGWPTVRGGRWASQDVQPAPVTDWAAGSEFNAGEGLAAWQATGGRWRKFSETQARGFVRQTSSMARGAYLTSDRRVMGDVRAEADLRLSPHRGGRAAGLVAGYRGGMQRIVAWLDRPSRALVTEVVIGGRHRARMSTALPRSFRFAEWHNVALEIRGSGLTVEVTDARLNDPVAVQHRRLPGTILAGSVGVAAKGRIDADNVGAARLYVPHTDVAPTPRVGAVDPDFSDEFNRRRLEPQWRWVREPDGQVRNGVFRWPTQAADLFGENNTASVVLRRAPAGPYTAEVKLAIDLGVNTDRSFQQAGMVVYLNDDHHLRLTHVAIFNTRQTEFMKEMPFADGISSGGMLIGTPAPVTWLRVSHRRDPHNGEHEFRAATSRDGRNWTWGGVWTLPEGTRPRLGLVSMGGSGATARFDYFRVHRP